MIFQTYSEVAFLTAEAVERFGYSGNAAEEYTKGVRAAMEMYALYDASLEVADADIITYLAANPYNAAQWEESLGEQYWAVTFLNEYESYANWGRTDYPKLIPGDYPGNPESAFLRFTALSSAPTQIRFQYTIEDVAPLKVKNNATTSQSEPTHTPRMATAKVSLRVR